MKRLRKKSVAFDRSQSARQAEAEGTHGPHVLDVARGREVWHRGTMNQSGNNFPFVQMSNSWQERQNGYSATPTNSRRQACLMVFAGFVIAMVVDTIVSEESLVALIAKVLA